MPVPVNATVCGLPTPLSRIVTVAERAPVRVGWNVTVIVQLDPAASPVPPIGQLLVWVNRAGFAPPSAMPLMINGTVPVLVSVTVCGALVVLMGTLPKAIEVGDRPTVACVVVPVRATVPVTAGAATATRTCAVRVTGLLFGVKVTLMVQVPPGTRPVPPMGQLCVMPKRAAFAPPSVIPVILRLAPPVFETVIVCGALVTLAAEVNVSAVGVRVSTGAPFVTVSTPGTQLIV